MIQKISIAVATLCMGLAVFASETAFSQFSEKTDNDYALEDFLDYLEDPQAASLTCGAGETLCHHSRKVQPLTGEVTDIYCCVPEEDNCWLLWERGEPNCQEEKWILKMPVLEPR